jgi:bacillithiol biosynthesis cysteine-adding enzyme BshC
VKLSGCSFSKLPFNSLFTDYTNQNEQLGDFFSHYPPDFDVLKNATLQRNQSHVTDRELLVKALIQYNERFDLPDGWKNNIQRLGHEQAVAVVTGQQSHVYGGPLYTIYKILSTIVLAAKLNEELDRPVVPVYWLGDEDHDFEEVSNVVIPRKDGLERIPLKKEENGDHRVCDLQFGDALSPVRSELKELLIDTDFSDDLWELLDSSFQADHTFGYATAHLFGQLFTKHGLVIAGSNAQAIKQLLVKPLQQSIANYDSLRSSLEQKSEKLRDLYHQQVTIYDSNLFWISDDEERIKIKHTNGAWQAGNQRWKDTDAIKSAIGDHPERFSPNVFLRPILQDHLLPTVAYVGGPGEISYYAQMKEFYGQFDLEMPMIWPRMSGTLIDSPVQRVLEKLPFEIEQYQQRIEDLESAYVEQAETIDIESVFGSWKKEAEEISTPYVQQVSGVDPTLENAAGKAIQTFANELDRLKGKVYRATKQQEKTQINRIHKIKNELFPEQGLQERSISFIYYMNKHGIDIWDDLLNAMQEIDYAHHQWIYLD